MSKLRVYRAEVNTTGSAGSKLRIYRAEITSNVQTSKLRVYRAEIKTAAPVSAGLDQINVEPGDKVTMTGSGGDGGAPSWTQLSGPAVALTVVGAVATFRAPPRIEPGALLTFRFAVSGAYDDVSITVLRALRATWNGAAWVGVVVYPKAVVAAP